MMSRLGLPLSRKLPQPSSSRTPTFTRAIAQPPPIDKPTHVQLVPNMSSVPAYRTTSASPSSSRKAVKSSASSSATSSRAPRSDPFYGHEETAVLCARFITSLFQCPNIPTATVPGAPTPTLAHFVAYALHRTRLPSVVTFSALLLLQRLKTRFPAARGSSGHRLFISAFMIASKVICDDTYSNQSWSIVAQKMFALKEINQMEREMCGYLEWNLNVSGEEVLAFESKTRAEHGPRAAFVTTSSSSSSFGELPVVHSPIIPAAYPTPDTTPNPQSSSRPIRPVPSPYKNKPHYQQSQTVTALPSPPASPRHYLRPTPMHSPAPHFASANSSLASSPASDDCKTPSPVAVTATSRPSSKGNPYEARKRQNATVAPLSGFTMTSGAW